jgi:hypothetical protein
MLGLVNLNIDNDATHHVTAGSRPRVQSSDNAEGKAPAPAPAPGLPDGTSTSSSQRPHGDGVARRSRERLRTESLYLG